MMRLLIGLACLFTVNACATAEAPHADGPPPPIDPSGTYLVRSELRLASPVPGPASAILADVRAATDDPDDPSRFLVDRIIAVLPEGSTSKRIAEELAPFLAAYLDARLASVAPGLLPGMHQVSDALASFSQRLDTIESVRIEPDHTAVVALTGLHLGKLDVSLATGGIQEPAVAAHVTFTHGELAIEDHRLALPYSRLVRLALDRGIIPQVDPRASDLPTLLVDLVDCNHLGQAVADAIGAGPPALYADACVVGLRATAAEWYEHMDALDGMTLDLAVHGDARGVDLDRDGHMDGIANGIWQGTLADVSVAGSTFDGLRQ